MFPFLFSPCSKLLSGLLLDKLSKRFSCVQSAQAHRKPGCSQVPASVSSGDTDGELGLATSSKLAWKILLLWENSQSFVSQGMAE